MAKKLKITELDQTIVPECELAAYDSPSDFIRELVAEAAANGRATHIDSEGCPVTAIVWDAE